MRSIHAVLHRALAVTLTLVLGLAATKPALADEPSLCCPADLATDGTIGPGDLSLLFAQWGGPGDADLDGSGVVDGDDLALLLDGWGDCPSPCLKTRLVGQVRFPDGSSASGAVVMSEFGGIATSAADGSFVFVVDVPSKATQMSVTATVTLGSTEYVGEVVASPIVLDGETPVDDIVLEPEACIPSWLRTVGPVSGAPNGQIQTMTTADLGSGPMLFVAGSFTSIGGIPANNIAAWDGQTWRALGSGVSGGPQGLFPSVFTMKAWDNGSGPQLFVGGRFLSAGGLLAGCISRWNGTSWASMGSGVNIETSWIEALEVYDDGTGPALYAAGAFGAISGVNAQYIARWKSAGWSSVGGNAIGNGSYALAVHDDGTGQKLYIGGVFENAGPEAACAIASWDGTAWRRVGTADDAENLPWGVYALKSVQVGSESRLYMGGVLTTSAGQLVSGVGYWTGKDWMQVGEGIFGVRELEVFSDESGPTIHAIGEVLPAPQGVPELGVYRWNGATWEGLQPRVTPYAIQTFDLGEGAELIIGGGFTTPIGSPLVLNGLARWDGETLRTFGNSVDATAVSMVEIAGPDGPEVIVGGSFTSAGGVAAPRVARWDGEDWSALGSGLAGTVNSLAMHDAGSGPQLYAGGTFTATGGAVANRVARWTGTAWEPLGVGANNAVNALLSFDDGSGQKLYAAGTFTSAGGLPASRIARWTGAAWEPVGSGTNGTIQAMKAFDDGTGTRLYIAGSFTTAGGVATGGIARWDGTSWSAVGAGIAGSVRVLAAHDDGTGVALYAGGDFTQAGGAPASRIARWDGSSWSAVGAGVVGSVRALSTFTVHGRDALFVGGDISSAGGQPATSLVYWDGSNWFNLGQGMTGTVNSLLRRSDGAALFVSGGFRRTPSGDAYFSRIGCTDD